MVQRVNYHQFSGNTVTLGAGGSRVVMGADSGNLKIQDSQSNTSIIEPGLKDGIIGGGLNATVYAKTSHYTITNEGEVDIIKGDFSRLFASTMTFLEITRDWTTIAINLNTIDVELPNSEPNILRVVKTNINPNNSENIITQMNERVHYNYGPYIELDLNNYNIRIRLTEDYLNYQTQKIYLYSIKVSPFLGAITSYTTHMNDYQASYERLTTIIKGKFKKLFDANMSFIELTTDWKIIARISNLIDIAPKYSSDLINIVKTNLNPNFVSMVNLHDKTISYY